MARPMPLVEPVTMATLPVRSKTSVLLMWGSPFGKVNGARRIGAPREVGGEEAAPRPR